MPRIVVTGASGFLGSHVADELSRRGHEVILYDKQPSRWRRPDQKMIVGDLLDREALAAALDGAQFVYHLAALADLNEARDRPVATAELNIVGTVGLLESARAVGVERVLFASTVYVYSRSGGFYRCSKQACEAYLEEFQVRYGLDYTVLRYGSLYGPRATEQNGVYRLLAQALEQGRVRHVGTAEDSREYIHVEDAARLSSDALEPAYANERIVLTGQHPMRLRDLFTMFSEILGRDIEVEYLPGGSDHGHYRVTPYAFTPRPGRKLTSNFYIDMGQGLLEMIEQMSSGAEEPR